MEGKFGKLMAASLASVRWGRWPLLLMVVGSAATCWRRLAGIHAGLSRGEG